MKIKLPLILFYALFTISYSLVAHSDEQKTNSIDNKHTQTHGEPEPQIEPDHFFYIGGKLGGNYYQRACESWSIDCEQSDFAFGLFGGYQFNDYFALEGAYIDLGSAVATYLETGLEQKYTGSMHGGEFSAIGSIPLSENTSIFAKAGAFKGYAENQSSTLTIKESNWAPMVGVGFNYQFATSWRARLEYQYFNRLGGDLIGGTEAHMVSLGISYQFGRERKPVKRKKRKPVEPKMLVLPEVKSSILFDFDRSNLLETSTLVPVVERLVKYPKARVLLKGYTDAKGTEEYNLQLSKRRTYMVSRYLIERGVRANQIKAEFFGKKFQLFDNLTPFNRHQNRHVEVVMPETFIPVFLPENSPSPNDSLQSNSPQNMTENETKESER